MNKNGIITLIAIVIVLGGVYYFLNRDTTPDELLVSVTPNLGDELGAEIVTSLARLNQIELDQSIFQSRIFTSLEDFTTELRSEPVGRTNPFSPVGGVVEPAEEE